jgi:acetyl-CoA carboxylase carboxyl transferase subunit alpha
MNPNYLDFEQPIAELEVKIEELQLVGSDAELNLSKEIDELRAKSAGSRRKSSPTSRPGRWSRWRGTRCAPTPWITSRASSPSSTSCTAIATSATTRPSSAVSRASTAGPVMVIGQEKGRAVKDKVYRNFGMPKPEGYRKALRLMELAERFSLPVITLIDTPGAYPGIDSEERGISESIATNLAVMSRLRTPDRLRGDRRGQLRRCPGYRRGRSPRHAAVLDLFRDLPRGLRQHHLEVHGHAADAAAMGVTSEKLQELGIVDATIEEPLGGAHRDPALMAERIREHLVAQLAGLCARPMDELLEAPLPAAAGLRQLSPDPPAPRRPSRPRWHEHSMPPWGSWPRPHAFSWGIAEVSIPA